MVLLLCQLLHGVDYCIDIGVVLDDNGDMAWIASGLREIKMSLRSNGRIA